VELLEQAFALVAQLLMHLGGHLAHREPHPG
jgi:hypothetical protein